MNMSNINNINISAYQINSSSSSIIMRGSRPLVIVSTADISVLHSTEVAYLYPQVAFPVYARGDQPLHTSEVCSTVSLRVLSLDSLE